MQFTGRIVGVVLFVLASAGGALAQPANNAFSAAWTLSGGTVFTNGNSTSATKETGEPAHAGNGGARSVWFNWTAPRDGQVRVDTVGSSIDTLLGVYMGSAVGALTLVASNDNTPGLGNASRVEFLAVQGIVYRIAVDVFNQFPQFPQFQPQGGPYVLNLQILASVKFTSPTNGAVVYVGNLLDLTVEAEVGNPPVTRVDFYRSGSLIGTDAAEPYGLTVGNPALGTNLFTAVAVDNGGLSWTSSVLRVALLNPGATIVTPVSGAVFQGTNSISVVAVTSVPLGAVTNVDFLVDDLKFAQDGTAPFSVTWSSVVGGIHRLTAISRDNSGNSYTSSPVIISVPLALIPVGSVWKYLDDGSDQGTNWTAREFNDSAWASGPAQLGYGEGDEATTVSFGGNPEAKNITTYFRRTFSVGGATNYTNLIFSVKRDDGAVVYVNGVDVARFNMPNGAITHLTPGTTACDIRYTLLAFRFIT